VTPVVDFDHEWPNLPMGFAQRVRDKLGLDLTYGQLHQLDLIVGMHAMPRDERVAAFRSNVDFYSKRAEILDLAREIITPFANSDSGVVKIPGDRGNIEINARVLADGLKSLSDFYRQAKTDNAGPLATLNRPGNRKGERNALWEALFIAWGTLLGQKIQLRRRGVVEFVQIASENADFASEYEPGQIIGFWDDNPDMKRRVRSKIAKGEYL